MRLRNLAVIYSVLLLLLIALVLIGYRVFVSIPKLEQGILALQQKELSTVQLAIAQQLKFLATLNYDYAVWTDSYNYLQVPDADYIADNFVDDTFSSLKIDGIFIYRANNHTAFSKAIDYQSKQTINFTEFDLQANPSNQIICPKPAKDATTVASKQGFLTTSHGIVMFSATDIKRSDRTGEHVGCLVFIKKFRPTLVKAIQQLAQLKIKLLDYQVSDANRYLSLNTSIENEGIMASRIRLINDVHHQPILKIAIEHSQQELPQLFDKATVITLISLTLIPASVLLLLTIYLIQPIITAAKKINQMLACRQIKKIPSISPISEITSLAENFNKLVDLLNQQQQKLEHQSLTDSLTEIANRRAFEQFYQQSWQSMQRQMQPLAVIICDIDYFKKYNDHYGHQAGDKVLTKVAQALAQRFSRSDDLVARYGGEEFIIVLKHCKSANLVKTLNLLMETIRDLAIAHEYSDCAKIITISAGAALFTDFSKIPVTIKPEKLISLADQKLYQAKETGRNRYKYSMIQAEN